MAMSFLDIKEEDYIYQKHFVDEIVNFVFEKAEHTALLLPERPQKPVEGTADGAFGLQSESKYVFIIYFFP